MSKELKSLLIQNKRVEVGKTKEGFFDHYEADYEWLSGWGGRIVELLEKIDNHLKTSYVDDFCNIHKHVSSNWRPEGSNWGVDKHIGNSKQSLQRTIEKVSNDYLE